MHQLLQMTVAQMRCLTFHRSSIDPDPTAVSIADKNPHKKIPTITATHELPAPARAQNAVYARQTTMFAGRLPKLSP